MEDYYCKICDKTINRKSKTKDIKSNVHLHMNSYVRKKHALGDVYWKDFETNIRVFVRANRSNFYVFKTLIECELYGENIRFVSDNNEIRVSLYGFEGCNFQHEFCVGKKIRDYLYPRGTLRGIELHPETIIKNLSKTFYSYYYLMTPKNRLQQPSRILESK